MAREEEPRVIAVFNVMRHSINEGDRLTAEGHALALSTGRISARTLLSVPGALETLQGNGLRVVNIHSPKVRTKQTAIDHYAGLVSNLALGRHVKDMWMHETPKLNIPEMLTAEGKKMDIPQREVELGKVYRGEETPHMESRKALLAEDRLGAVALVLKNISRKLMPGEARGKQPLLYLNYVTHGGIEKTPGNLNMLAELIIGKKPAELGGQFKQAEGMQFFVYSDGNVKTRITRQDPRENKWV